MKLLLLEIQSIPKLNPKQYIFYDYWHFKNHYEYQWNKYFPEILRLTSFSTKTPQLIYDSMINTYTEQHPSIKIQNSCHVSS